MNLLVNTLDITSFKQKGQELRAEILKEVKGIAESSLIVTLPDSIRMTQAQYDDLMEIADMPNMYHSEDRMYVTPYNIMEVRVSGRKKLTFTEVHSLDDKSFSEWEKSVEGDK
jgi:hypothetical protein